MSVTKTAVYAVLAPIFIYGGIFLGMHVLKSGWAAILLYHLALSAVLTATGGWSLVAGLFRGWKTVPGVGLVVFSSLVGAVVYVAWSKVQITPDSIAHTVGAIGLQGPSLALFGLYYILVNPALEEIFWRGWYGANCKWPLATDALFAGYHLVVVVLFLDPFFILVTFCVLLGAAWVWRFCVRKYDGLAIPFFAHTVADMGIMAALFLRV